MNSNFKKNIIIKNGEGKPYVWEHFYFMQNFSDAVKQFSNLITGGFNGIVNYLYNQISTGYMTAVRWILPLLAVIILIRCILPLLSGRKNNMAWGYLVMSNGTRFPLMHWENSIGRSKVSDVVINLPFISRSHAVLTYRDGEWLIADLGSKGGVELNGTKIKGQEKVNEGDVISLAGLELTLVPAEKEENQNSDPKKSKISGLRKLIKPQFTLLLIVLFQVLGAIELCIAKAGKLNNAVPITFGLIVILECAHFIAVKIRRSNCFEFEMLAYFLCGIGLFVVASYSANSLFKQFGAIVVGVAAFSALSFAIRDLERARKLKYVLLAAALALLLMNIVFGQIRNGAKNWISLGAITFQPTEFVKVAFVLVGTATLDRLLTTRNLTSFIAFSGACIGTLAITKDFGTALVFFCAFLVIAFMRSGDLRSIALILAGAILGALAVVSFMPYVSSRFKAWGHVWQYADSSGYQQTRTMIAAASGGLLGLGGGKGYLVHIGAAGTDLVFGVVCEEWGLIIALVAVSAVVFLALFSASSVGKCKSSFYAIAACGAASMLLTQTALNVFGSFDILPLTGVTLPFVSNGGSSMIACWCLLAFIKSADSRPGNLDGKPDKVRASYGKGITE